MRGKTKIAYQASQLVCLYVWTLSGTILRSGDSLYFPRFLKDSLNTDFANLCLTTINSAPPSFMKAV